MIEAMKYEIGKHFHELHFENGLCDALNHNFYNRYDKEYGKTTS